jgi:hypothetical protein
MTKQIPPEMVKENLVCVFCGRPIKEAGVVYLCFSVTAKCFNGITSRIDESYNDAKKDYTAHFRCGEKRNMWVSTQKLNTWEVVKKAQTHR